MMTDTIVPTEKIQKAINRNPIHETASKKIISKYALITSGASLLPYDFVDIATSTVTQTLMIRELAQFYDVPVEGKMIRVAFWSAVGSALTKALTSVVQSIISNTSGNRGFDLTGAAVAGVYTATLGEFYRVHLRDGGTLENIDVNDFVNFFIDEVKGGDLSLATFTNPKTLLDALS